MAVSEGLDVGHLPASGREANIKIKCSSLNLSRGCHPAAVFAYSHCTQQSPAFGCYVFFREFQEESPCTSELRHDVSVLRLKLLFLCRALEERLQGKSLSSAGLELEQVLLQLDVAQKKEQHLQSEVTRLENR